MRFWITFCCFGFSCHFSVARSYYRFSIFSICYMFYLHFWETSFSNQSSADVRKREVGSKSSTHCSSVLFGYFEQVFVCWRSITLNYRRFFWSFWVNFGCVCVRFGLIKFFTFCVFAFALLYTCKYISRVSIHHLVVSLAFESRNYYEKFCYAYEHNGLKILFTFSLV